VSAGVDSARTRGAPLLAAASLARRELVRFFRQRKRVIGTVLQPLVFWLLLGTALSGSFRPGGAGAAGYVEYLYPGALALLLLFSSIFSTITVIEDRREGFLQSVLVAPVPAWSLVAGKVLGGSALAFLQGLVFLLLAPLGGIPVAWAWLPALLALMLLVAAGLVALGFCLAWRSETTAAYHAMMSAFLFPMWLLSGAMFPAAGTPAVLAALIAVNPLTYGVALLRRALHGVASGPVAGVETPSLWLALAVTVVFTVLALLAAGALAKTRTTADLL
jgi:ABC-2 type transport system permease protein